MKVGTDSVLLGSWVTCEKANTILDVGSGTGLISLMLAQRNLNSNIIGIEIDQISSKEAQLNIRLSNWKARIEIINIPLQKFRTNKKFDLITMFHALEHIPNPIKTFKLLYELLNNEGSLFIEVPNIETKDASPHNIYFKAHIHYFSSSTLTSAASKYFEKIDEDIGSNLRILFKRKDTVEEDLTYPSLEQINHSALRLQEKGWFEYLINGRGYKKLPLRIKQLYTESRLNYDSSIEVLDDILRS